MDENLERLEVIGVLGGVGVGIVSLLLLYRIWQSLIVIESPPLGAKIFEGAEVIG